MARLDLPIWFYYSLDDRLLNKRITKKRLNNEEHNMKVISRTIP